MKFSDRDLTHHARRSPLSFFVGILLLSLFSIESILNLFATYTFSAHHRPSFSSSNVDTDTNTDRTGKVLVIVMGNLRGGEATWKTLISNALEVNNADLALLIGELDKKSPLKNSSLVRRAKYIWTFPEYDDWTFPVDEYITNYTAWRDYLPPVKKNETVESTLWGPANDMRGSGLLIMVLRYFASQHILQLNLTEQYERFIITRSDFYYGCVHNISDFMTDNDSLWVPEGEEYRGYTDRHLVTSHEHVLQALNILPVLLSGPNPQFKSWLSSEEYNHNPEQLLKYVWQDIHHLQVKQFKRVMFTVGIPNVDSTRWSEATHSFPPDIGDIQNLKIKYWNEYVLTNYECRSMKHKQFQGNHIQHYNNKNKSKSLGGVNLFESFKPYCIFQDAEMSFCQYQSSSDTKSSQLHYHHSQLQTRLSFGISKTMVEHHYNCSADLLQEVCEINSAKFQKQTPKSCLFIFGSLFHSIDPYYNSSSSNNNNNNKRNVTNVTTAQELSQSQIQSRSILHNYRMIVTDAYLESLNISKLLLPHGDASYLLPFLFDFHSNNTNDNNDSNDNDNNDNHQIKEEEEEQMFCFVPHPNDQDNIIDYFNQTSNSLNSSNVHILSIQSSTPQWNDYVNEFLKCKYISTSWLQGKMIADALGIPTQWFSFYNITNTTTVTTTNTTVARMNDTDTISFTDEEEFILYEEYISSLNMESSKSPSHQIENIQDINKYVIAMTAQERQDRAKQMNASFPYELFTLL